VESGDVAELVRISHDLMEAIRTRNRTVLDAVLLPDFVQVDERGNRQGKSAFISAVEASTFQVDQLKFETLSVEPFDHVAAVCGVQWAQVRMPGGEQAEGRTAFTDVFIRGAEGWRLRLATSAELPVNPQP
jgi:ketosteroid isomerase-like protein